MADHFAIRGIHRLREESHGNGGGMALADIVSKKFYEALDMELTWKHMISCNWTVGGKIPVCAGTDAEVYLACARTAGVRDLATCRGKIRHNNNNSPPESASP